MKANLVRLTCCLLMSASFLILTPGSSKAQSAAPTIVRPTEIYRFLVSTNDRGFFLTGNFQEGVALGYLPETLPMRTNRSNFSYMGIYVPPSGYTPDPAAGLVPLYRWLVIQDGWRNYYYYSTYYFNLGGDYHFQGIQGYVLPPNQVSFRGIELTHMSSFYSQDFGYWNGTGIPVADVGLFFELPPDGSYTYQGVVCAVPGAVTGTRFPPPAFQQPATIFDVLFYPPPPPPPAICNASSAIKNKCSQLGGTWNDDTCSCDQFVN